MTEDEVIRKLQDLAVAGEYLDTMLGIPGAQSAGGGIFVGNQRMYERGSAEFLDARAAGLIQRLPPLIPVRREAVEAAEREFGYPFPALLRRLYLEVGNGGFGPGYGLFRLPFGDNNERFEWSSLPAS